MGIKIVLAIIIVVILILAIIKRKEIKKVFLRFFGFEMSVEFKENKNEDEKSDVAIEHCSLLNSAFQFGKVDNLKFKNNNSFGYDNVLSVDEAKNAEVSENIAIKNIVENKK